eukprot:7435799-Alexandrium_andersonii.AAC.1
MPPPVQESSAGLPSTARNEDGSRRELGADAEDDVLRRSEAPQSDREAPQAEGHQADRSGSTLGTGGGDPHGSSASRGPDL